MRLVILPTIAIALFFLQPRAEKAVEPVSSVVKTETATPKLEDPVTYARRATVTVSTGRGNGSGVVVSPDGLIVSNFHVVKEVCPNAPCDRPLSIRFNSGVASVGRVLAVDKNHDLSMIKVNEQKIPFLQFDSDIVKGENVFAIGTPCGKPDVVTSGEVLGTPGEKVGGSSPPEWHFLHGAVIKPGNSGGSVVTIQDGAPRLVGINVGVPRSQSSKGDQCADPPPGSISIAISASTVQQFIKESGF